MKLKLDDAGHVIVSDGKPVFVHDDGSEVAFDAQQTVSTISRLNGEAKAHREAKERAEAALKQFEGMDAKAAKDALSKLANIDAKKLIDAGEVEKVRAEISKVYEERLAAESKRASDLESALYDERIGGAFARSEYVKAKLAIPSDFVQARFGQQFKLEDGKVVAYDATGNKVYSKSRPGELADFDEALEFLVNAYPQRDYILKGTGADGSGSKGSAGKSGGQKSLTRAAFDALSPADKTAKMRDGFTVTD